MPQENHALEPDLDSEILMSIKCDEPGGTVVRNVRRMQLTPANLRIFWEKASRYRTIFNSVIRNDFKQFTRLLLRENSAGEVESTGLFWVVDDFVGVFYMTNIRPELDASVHYSFFDGRHRGRVELTKAMLKYAFERYNFQRLTVEIPRYATDKTRNFVETWLGFRKEGRKRKAALFDGEYFDVNIYGILRSEVLENGS